MASSNIECFICYGTLGRGLDDPAKTYLTQKLFPYLKQGTNDETACSIIDYAEGKLVFQCSMSCIGNFKRAMKSGIKFFERLFVLIDRKPLVEENGSVFNKRMLFDHIYDALINSDSLPSKIRVWQTLQTLLTRDHSGNEKDFEGTSEIEISTQALSFRLSVKCTGKWRRKIDVTRLCENLGPKIADRMQWKINLRKPNVEISIRVSDTHSFIGLPLTREPLSNRSYIKHMGLRGSVCDALVQLADIRKGSIVLDPMCGSGTILFEAAAQSMNLTALGVDIDQRQLALAHDNLAHFAEEKSREIDCNNKDTICIFPADCRRLPFKNCTFDRIISDIPFGQQHSNSEELKTLYPQAIKEMFRVVKKEEGCRVVLLTGKDSYSLLQSCVEDAVSQLSKRGEAKFEERSKIDISLGETDGVIVVLTTPGQ